MNNEYMYLKVLSSLLAMFNNVLIYGQRLKFASFVLQLINEAHKRLDNNPQALLLTQCNPILLNISRLSCQLTFMMQVLEESTLGHEIEQEDSALLNNMKNLNFLIKTKAEFERVVKLFKPKVSDLNMCIHKMQNMEYKSLHLDLEVQKLCVGFWRGLLAYYQTYYETDNEIKLLLREESSDLWAACKIDCLRMMNFKGNADPSLVFIYKLVHK